MGVLEWYNRREVMIMANVAKYDRSQIGGLTRHFERHKKDDCKYQEFGNQDIDISKTNLNYNLAPTCDGGKLSFINNCQ
jgi:hypothetical protein